MRILDRAEERLATSPGQFVRDRLGDKPAPVPFEPINTLDQLGGQRDSDALRSTHRESMTSSMIILKRLFVSGYFGRQSRVKGYENSIRLMPHAEARQNSSALIFAASPATIEGCQSCSSRLAESWHWRSAAIGIGFREHRPPSAARRDETCDEAAPPPGPRPPVLGWARPTLAQLSHRLGARGTGHGCTVASRVAPPPMDTTFRIPFGWASANRSAASRPRPRDGDRESLMGSPADSRRAAHTWCRRVRTHRVATPETASTPVFANVANVSHESSGLSGVDGLPHRADGHRPGLVRRNPGGASVAAHRARQHHRAPDGHLDRPTGGRGVPGGLGPPLVAPRS